MTTSLSLAEWQQRFLQSVQNQSSHAAMSTYCRHATDAHTQDSNQADDMTANALAARLAAYDGNYHQGLQSWLRDIFTNTMQFVGEAYFSQLTRTYVSQQHLTETNLDDYERRFPAFVKTHQQTSPHTHDHAELAYLTDIAELDIQLYRAYYASNRSAFDIASFAALPADAQQQVCFSLADDLHLMTTDAPLYDIWRLHRGEIDNVTATDTPQTIAIHRPQFHVSVLPSDALSQALFDALTAQTPLYALLEMNTDFAPLFNQWIQSGWIVGYVEF